MSAPAWIRPVSSHWKCPLCSSLYVEVSRPAWFHETAGGELRFIEPDEGADVIAWHCTGCSESGEGPPARNRHELEGLPDHL